MEEWSRRYADRIDNWRLSASKTKQHELAVQYATDGYTLLQAVYAPASPGWLRELPAVQTLRCVLVQNYIRTPDRAGRLRIRQRERAEDGGDGLPPAPIRLASPYDTDTRWSAKRDLFWNGFKLHVSETCHPQADGDRPAGPNLITNVTTTCSTLPDSKALDTIHQSLHRRHLLPARHYLDSGYPSADLIVSSAKDYGIALVTPVLLDTSSGQGPTRLRRPRLHHRLGSQAGRLPGRKDQRHLERRRPGRRGQDRRRLRRAGLHPLPDQGAVHQLTKGPSAQPLPRELTEAIRTARAQQQDGTWQRDYALRAGVEGSIRQATHTTGLRRAATAASQRPTSTTPPAPPPSTSSDSTPGGTATPSTAPTIATSPDFNSALQLESWD